MYKITNAIKWIFHNFFYLALAVFVIFYLRWFQLTPFVTPGYLTNAYIFGICLFVIYVGLVIVFSLTRPNDLKTVFYIASVTFLVLNSLFLFIHMPRIEFTDKCSGVTYYITSVAPLSDEQWTFEYYSKSEGLFKYKSLPFLGTGVRRLVCDEENDETHFINGFDVLSYIDGENPQSFYEYTSAHLNDSLYLLSENWPQEYCIQISEGGEYWTCEVSIYKLYKCKSNYTDCNPLPIIYRSDDSIKSLRFSVNDKTKEISLFEMDSETDDETLIFTYGKISRCYVDQCTINTK